MAVVAVVGFVFVIVIVVVVFKVNYTIEGQNVVPVSCVSGFPVFVLLLFLLLLLLFLLL